MTARRRLAWVAVCKTQPSNDIVEMRRKGLETREVRGSPMEACTRGPWEEMPRKYFWEGEKLVM